MTAVYQSRNGAAGLGRTDDEDRKLFLGGLSWETTEDDIVAYFNKYGTPESVSIKYDAVTRNPRGFGFITFTSADVVDRILDDGPHMIREKQIDPKRAKSRAVCKKIFVGGVDANLTEDELRDYFSMYGNVAGIELPFDRVRGRRREFCFIIFDTEESADAACRNPKQNIAGREVDINKARPQQTKGPRTQYDNSNVGGGYSNGNGYSSYGRTGGGEEGHRGTRNSGPYRSQHDDRGYSQHGGYHGSQTYHGHHHQQQQQGWQAWQEV